MILLFWPDEARPPTRYVFKHIKIKITELYISDIQFGDKTIQRWKLPNSFARESYSYTGMIETQDFPKVCLV